MKKEIITELKTTHGLTNERIYKIWAGMKCRCYNSNVFAYKDYGGREITVCPEWKNDFQSFYDWAMANGYDDMLTIDRIDVNGNYEPSNFRWVDRKTQCRNTRFNHIVEYQGQKMCFAEAAERIGIKRETMKSRYARGERGEIIFRPARKYKQ